MTLSQTGKYKPATWSTAFMFWFGKVKFDAAIADFCDMVEEEYVGTSRSSIIGKSGIVGTIWIVTCTECGRRFTDINHCDPTDSHTQCPHCQELVQW